MSFSDDDLINSNQFEDSSEDDFGETEFLEVDSDDSRSSPHVSGLLVPGPSKAKEPRVSGSKSQSAQKRKNDCSTLLPGNAKKQKEKPLVFKGEVVLKNFKNQKGSDSCGIVDVEADNCEGLLRKVWDYCAPFVHRGVVFNDTPHDKVAAENDPSIALISWEEELPSFETCWKFISFHDRLGKRYICPSKIDSKQLLSWEDKDMAVILFKYSASVTKLERWNLLKDKLLSPMEKDRAGAEAISSVNAVKAELKERHGRYLSAEDIIWFCWANYICAKSNEDRAALIDSSPPAHMLELFTTVPVHSDTLLEKGRLDLQVASTVTASYRTIVDQMENDHQQVVNLVTVQGQRIAHLREKLNEHDAMLKAMKSSVSATENRFSLDLVRSVTDCPDDQHM